MKILTLVAAAAAAMLAIPAAASAAPAPSPVAAGLAIAPAASAVGSVEFQRDRRHHRRAYYRKVCRTTWRHHRKVRTCRRVRYYR